MLILHHSNQEIKKKIVVPQQRVGGTEFKSNSLAMFLDRGLGRLANKRQTDHVASVTLLHLFKFISASLFNLQERAYVKNIFYKRKSCEDTANKPTLLHNTMRRIRCSSGKKGKITAQPPEETAEKKSQERTDLQGHGGVRSVCESVSCAEACFQMAVILMVHLVADMELWNSNMLTE